MVGLDGMDFRLFDTYGIPTLFTLAGALLLFVALVGGRRHRLVSDLPTSKTTGVFIGLVEVKGTAEAEEPLVSFLAGSRASITSGTSTSTGRGLSWIRIPTRTAGRHRGPAPKPDGPWSRAAAIKSCSI